MSEETLAEECFAVAQKFRANADRAIGQTDRVIALCQEAIALSRQWQERALKAESELERLRSAAPQSQTTKEE